MKKVLQALRAISKITRSNDKELYKAEGIDDIFYDPNAELRRIQYREVQHVSDSTETPKALKDLLDLMKLVGLQLHAVTEDLRSAEKEKLELSTKASQEEGVLRRTEAKVLKLQKVHAEAQNEHSAAVPSNKAEAYHEMVRDAMVDYNVAVLELNQCTLQYKELEIRQMCLRTQFDALSSQVAHMRRGEVGVSLSPRPLCSQFDFQKPSDFEAISMRPCALCMSGFPLNNIIVCTCGHLYHPWCAGIWFRVASTCADASCGTTVHLAWFSSFGFGQLHAPLLQLVQSLKLEEEQERLMATLTSTILDSHPDIGTHV